MNEKPYLYLDFDDTIVDSLPVVVDILNKKYGTNYHPDDIKRWDMTDCYPNLTAEELNWAFECDYFWDNVDFKPNAFYVLSDLQYLYNIHIISKGTKKNLKRKNGWIAKHLNWNRVNVGFIPIKVEESKGDIYMSRHSIMVDDNEQYLEETNATMKILYVSYPNKAWNKHWTGITESSWHNLFATLKTQASLMNGGIVNE